MHTAAPRKVIAVLTFIWLFQSIGLAEGRPSGEPILSASSGGPDGQFELELFEEQLIGQPTWRFETGEPLPVSLDEAIRAVHALVVKAAPDGDWKFCSAQLQLISARDIDSVPVYTVTFCGETRRGGWPQPSFLVLPDGTVIEPTVSTAARGKRFSEAAKPREDD